MTDLREHYENERRWENRCPRCGKGPATAAYHMDGYGSGFGEACAFYGCGYSWAQEPYEPEPPTEPPFIMPGDPGSHDQLSDYDPPEDA